MLLNDAHRALSFALSYTQCTRKNTEHTSKTNLHDISINAENKLFTKPLPGPRAGRHSPRRTPSAGCISSPTRFIENLVLRGGGQNDPVTGSPCHRSRIARHRKEFARSCMVLSTRQFSSQLFSRRRTGWDRLRRGTVSECV